MEHIAIDLGRRYSQVCIRIETGEITHEEKLATSVLSAWLSERSPARVILETCTEAFVIAERAKADRHDVRVVPATLVRQLGVGQRGLKNDTRDARALSEASCRLELPSVHIPSASSRALKELCTSRELLVKMRTSAVCRVRSALRGAGIAPVRATPNSLPGKLRTKLTGEHAELLSRIEPVLRALESLSVEVKVYDKELRELAKRDSLCRRLMSVPGVGPVTSIRFVAAIDDVTRFPSGALVASYLGLTPGENTTGFKTRRTGITKAGPSRVRWTLVQAAWTLYRYRPNDPIVRWARRIEERRGKRKAVVALARKLSTVMYAIWRDGTSYEPKRVSPWVTQEGERMRAQLHDLLTTS